MHMNNSAATVHSTQQWQWPSDLRLAELFALRQSPEKKEDQNQIRTAIAHPRSHLDPTTGHRAIPVLIMARIAI
jgi:hypothetical protein